MNLLLTLIQTLAIMSAISFGMLIVMAAITMFIIRRKVRGHIYCYFLEENNQISREMCKLQGSGRVRSSWSEDMGEYLIQPDKQFWSKWPPGLPDWMQESVAALIFTRNNPEPFNPKNMMSEITSKSLRFMLDEGMLKSTWEDARSVTGSGPSILGGNLLLWLNIAVLIAVAILGFITYQNMQEVTQTSENVTDILDQLRGL